MVREVFFAALFGAELGGLKGIPEKIENEARLPSTLGFVYRKNFFERTLQADILALCGAFVDLQKGVVRLYLNIGQVGQFDNFLNAPKLVNLAHRHPLEFVFDRHLAVLIGLNHVLSVLPLEGQRCKVWIVTALRYKVLVVRFRL